jgi:hypothetical protein
MTNVLDIYKALAVRINYPVTPTYRCLQKIIGYINLLLSLSNTPQVIVEVQLSGEPNKRYYKRANEKIAYLLDGKPCKLNPDGTIHTKDETAFVIRTGLFQSLDTGEVKNFITTETDVLSDDYYLQPILTSLFLVISGVQPSEAVMYINDACSRSNAKADLRQVDISKITRRL